VIAADALRRPQLDDPWRRLIWLTPSALLLWAVLLAGFAALLQSSGPRESIERLDARLIDLPPAAPAGLQGSAETAPAPAAAPVAQPQPRSEPQPVPHPHVKKQKPAPPRLYDVNGPHTAPAAEQTANGQPPTAESGAVVGGVASGRAGLGGLGTDSLGARAIYAPVPTIPDDLREHVFETVAVAHFQVSFDGSAKVSLIRPTSNPRLNGILLDTLKQWRFFPAIRSGIAIESEFDVRIPIAVQER
jgi:periplasmic protein TonB